MSEYTKNSFKVKFVGEIVGYSYIKLNIESTSNPKHYNNGVIPLRGDYYEAVSSTTFKIIGSYNTNTLTWKLDCFDQSNTHISVFMGKENAEGNVKGKWNNKKISCNFYINRIKHY